MNLQTKDAKPPRIPPRHTAVAQQDDHEAWLADWQRWRVGFERRFAELDDMLENALRKIEKALRKEP